MSILNYIRFLIKYRNVAEIISRGMYLWKRYGLNTNKMQKYLGTYQELLARYDIIPTFFITGDVLERHTQLVQTFVSGKVDLGIHGYHHIDLTKLTFRNQKQQIERAIRAFQRASIPFSGFRCPYLRWNENTLNAVEKLNFLWNSSHTILWDGIEREIPEEKLPVYQKYLELYDFENASEYSSVPRFHNNLVEIPVSLPDDDILIDRLGVVDSTRIDRIWRKILSKTYKKGDLFVLQLHPERIALCKVALESLLEASKTYKHPIWVASLSEISCWWRERNTFGFRLKRNEDGCYRIQVTCSNRCTVLVKNITLKHPTKNFFNGYKIVGRNQISIEASTRPAIGVSKKAAPNLIAFLKNEGFFFEVSDKREEYGIYFNGDEDAQGNEIKVLNSIESSQVPIIRYWRWPMGAKSALAITGDIDSITLVDFWMRILGG